MQRIDEDASVTELQVLGSSFSRKRKNAFYFDCASVVAKNLRNDVVIQTASSLEVEILSANGTNPFS